MLVVTPTTSYSLSATAIRRRADQRAPLRTGEAEKSPAVAPQADLQAVLAEYAVERFLDDPGFLVQQRLAERRCQPVLEDL